MAFCHFVMKCFAEVWKDIFVFLSSCFVLYLQPNLHKVKYLMQQVERWKGSLVTILVTAGAEIANLFIFRHECCAQLLNKNSSCSITGLVC